MRTKSAALRLAVDARDLARDHRGLGRYARAILRRFARRSDVELTLVVRWGMPWSVRRSLAAALGSANFEIASRTPRSSALVWHPWNGIFLRGGPPEVATIADLAPFRFPASDAARRNHQQAPFRNAIARAKQIITLSESSKRDLIELLAASPERVAVTHLGVDETFSPGRPENLPLALRARPYFFFVGDPHETRKNFALLYRAFSRAWPRGDGPSLAVLCARNPGLRGVVHLTLDTEDVHNTVNTRLRSLYRGALATTVPALYEGFGLPAIESMACGTPVVASLASSLPEIAGDAALLVNPNDESAWMEALQRIAADRSLRDSLQERGLQNARRFTWEACAEQTLAILKEGAEL